MVFLNIPFRSANKKHTRILSRLNKKTAFKLDSFYLSSVDTVNAKVRVTCSVRIFRRNTTKAHLATKQCRNCSGIHGNVPIGNETCCDNHIVQQNDIKSNDTIGTSKNSSSNLRNNGSYGNEYHDNERQNVSNSTFRSRTYCMCVSIVPVNKLNETNSTSTNTKIFKGNTTRNDFNRNVVNASEHFSWYNESVFTYMNETTNCTCYEIEIDQSERGSSTPSQCLTPDWKEEYVVFTVESHWKLLFQDNLLNNLKTDDEYWLDLTNKSIESDSK